MATNIKSTYVGGINIQSGNGIPTHLSPKGDLFIDMDVPREYLSNGDSSWEVTTGGGGSGGITGFTYDSNTNTLILGLTGGTFSATINSFSDLTINSPFNFIDGNQSDRYVLTSNSGGTATWQTISQNNNKFSASTNNQTLFTNVITITPYDITKVELYVNGQKQLYGLDYTITGGTDLSWLDEDFKIYTDDLLELVYL